MKIILTIAILALSIPPLFLAHQSTDPVWQSFLAGLSSSLVVLGIGILAINLYLESASRKNAVKALFMLSQTAIAEFHNDFLRASWAKFGREEFGRIVQEFMKAKQDVSALKKDVRTAIYDLYVNSPTLKSRVMELENVLSELTRMVGWSLDARLLTACLLARTTMAEIRSTELNGTDETIDAITKHILRLDKTTSAARKSLMALAGIKEEDDSVSVDI